MSFFIADALAQPAAAQPPGAAGGFMFPVLMIGMLVLMYFMTIRPQRKRQKEHADMIGNLAKGDEVVTTGGLLGRVVKVEEDYVALKVADNVELKFQKHAVHAVLPKGTLKSV